jgi:pyruvate dehydrogenase E2 component (dihydrolipoamide acetyltransferase)
MAHLLRMPEISANTVEAVLAEWPLAADTTFKAGEAIATVETDKAVVDVPADADGVLLRTLIEPGKSVSVGTPMAVLGAPGEVIDDLDALVERLTGESAPAAAARAADDPSPAGTREVSQSAEPGAAPAVAAPPFSAPPAVATAAASAALGGAVSDKGQPPIGVWATPDVVEPPVAAGAAPRIFASPIARRIARENGLAVEDIAGTGPGGRILRDDVRRALAGRVSAAVPAVVMPEKAVMGAPVMGAAGSGVAGAGSGVAGAGSGVAGAGPGFAEAESGPVEAGSGAARTVRTDPGRFVDVPHTRMRRAIAARLAESSRDAPVFAIRGSARVDALLALRREINATAGVPVSINDLIVAAAARAHVAVPELNAIWLPDAVRRFTDVDIAVAVATDTGLVTPVLRGVQQMTVSALASASADLVARSRAGKLRQDELEGGSLTVTNLGVFGTEDFTAVINPPQAAILAVGAARQEPVVTDGELGVATVLRVTLSVDHRPVDGATGARWMAAFLALLEAPLRILI